MKNWSLNEIIIRNLNGRIVLIWFSAATLAYLTMLFVTIPMVAQFSGGLDILDMRPAGYDLANVLSLFDTLGEDGRTAYLFYQIPVDMIYPGLFAISNCLLLAYVLGKISKLGSPLFYFCFLPGLAGAADYLENIGITVLLINYPDISNWMVSLTNVFSLIKSGTTTLSFLVLLILVTIWGFRFLRNRGASRNG